jgi:hypothetical protein
MKFDVERSIEDPPALATSTAHSAPQLGRGVFGHRNLSNGTLPVSTSDFSFFLQLYFL